MHVWSFGLYDTFLHVPSLSLNHTFPFLPSSISWRFSSNIFSVAASVWEVNEILFSLTFYLSLTRSLTICMCLQHHRVEGGVPWLVRMALKGRRADGMELGGRKREKGEGVL